MHSELLALVSVKSKKFHFFSNVLKPEKEKLCFISPDEIPLCWKGKVFFNFTYPKNDVFKGCDASVNTKNIFFTSVQLLLDHTSITALQVFISSNMGVCSMEDTWWVSYHIRIYQNITKIFFPSKSLSLINSEQKSVIYNEQINHNYTILFHHVSLHPLGFTAKTAGETHDNWRWKGKTRP